MKRCRWFVWTVRAPRYAAARHLYRGLPKTWPTRCTIVQDGLCVDDSAEDANVVLPANAAADGANPNIDLGARDSGQELVLPRSAALQRNDEAATLAAPCSSTAAEEPPATEAAEACSAPPLWLLPAVCAEAVSIVMASDAQLDPQLPTELRILEELRQWCGIASVL